MNAVAFRLYPAIEPVCRTIQSTGFDTIEVSRPHFYDALPTSETRRQFRARMESFGLKMYGFDCWVEVEPFDAMEETLADFERAIAFADDLELGMIISHDTWAKTNGERSPGEVLRTNVELFRAVAERTVAAGLQLVFEPHPDTLSMDNAWCVDFIDAVADGHPSGHVGILYDTCHYGVGQPDSYVEAIEHLGQRIRHLHFSDGDAKTYAMHLPIGDGQLELERVVDALRNIAYDGTVTCDMFNCPLVEDGARRSLKPFQAIEAQLQP